MIKYNTKNINKVATDSTINKMYYGADLAYTYMSSETPTPILPYTELDYVQTSSASGKGGIQLLNNPTSDLLIEMDIQISGTSEIQIIGQKDDKEVVSYQMGFMQYNSNTRFYYDYGGGRISNNNSPSFNIRRKWTIGRISGTSSPNVCGVKTGNTVVSSIAGTTIQIASNRPLCCGNIKYNGSSTPRLNYTKAYLKIYSIKVYTTFGLRLVGDYIPVRRTSDGVATLYDKVSENYATPYGSVIGSDE